MRRGILASIALAALGCGSAPEIEGTSATLEPVRGSVEVGEAQAAPVTRVAPGVPIVLGERARAQLTLDHGPALLLDAQARLSVDEEGRARLEAGRIFAEVEAGDTLELDTEELSLRATDAAASIARADGTTEIYVVHGELAFRRESERGTARAGERLRVSARGVEREPATLWTDWTGGVAQPGLGDARGPRGLGALEARVPDEVGLARWPLSIRRLDVRVRIEGDLAITEVDQTFFNPASETVEGLYRVRVPEGAVLQRFAVDRDQALIDGYIREKALARREYQARVYRGSTEDPALLEWDAPGAYQARIYPIAPGATRRVLIRYAEWVGRPSADAARLYRYPMGGGERAPHVQELFIDVDVSRADAERVRAGMGARVERDAVRIRRSDFRPRADFWLELEGGPTDARVWTARHEPPRRAPGSSVTDADERDYLYVPLVLPASIADASRASGIDLVILADVSAATDRAQLELGRTVVEALAAQLGGEDRIAIVGADIALRSLGEGSPALVEASPERIEPLLDALARTRAAGATDIGAALTSAAGLLDPNRPGAVVYVGDAWPTVGELAAEGLLERVARLPNPLRLYGVGVGSYAQLELLEALTRGGGLALRVEERGEAADAAMRILAHASRPLAQGVTVDLGPDATGVYPRRPTDVVLGEVLPVAARYTGNAPREITVRGTVAGEAFEEQITLRAGQSADANDLRLRWASERLRQLLLEGASREEVVELGTRYGLITPFTSFYVPSRFEVSRLGPEAEDLIDRPLLPIDPEPGPFTRGARTAFGILLSPLGIAGCSLVGSEDEAAPAPTSMTESAPGQGMAGESAADLAPAAAQPTPGPTGGAFAEPEPEEAMVDDLQPAPSAAPGAPPRPSRQAARPTDRDGRFGDLEGGSVGAAGLGLQGTGRGGGGTATGRGRSAGEAIGQRSRRPQATNELLDPFASADEDEAPDVPAEPPARDSSGEEQRRVDQTVTVTVTSQIRGDTTALRRPRRCSEAATLPLADREALWRERLGAAGTAAAWMGVMREAARQCETPSWRDRRAFISRVLERAGSIEAMVEVHRLLTDRATRDWVRGRIMARVDTPDALRRVRSYFGLGRDPDPELLAQVLARARDGAGRVRALRELIADYPESVSLKLRLLALLEELGRIAEAERLADALRVDPMSDAEVRTAIGELYLRTGQEIEARRAFSEIVEFSPLDEVARRRLGDLYRAHGWYEDAYRQYLTLADIRPDDPSVWLLLAQAAAGAGRVDEALRFEERVAQTAQPGVTDGLARAAILWSSVRYAQLRHAAREAGDDERLEALARRMRRGGVLREAGPLRVTLVWSHPDAGLSLLAAHPGLSLSRPIDLYPEFGLEAFHLEEQEAGTYRFAIRRAGDRRATLEAKLVIVWNEGGEDEAIRIEPLSFDPEREAYGFAIEGTNLRATRPEAR